MSLHPSLQNRPPTPSDDVCHVICCNHDHLTLCGFHTEIEAVDDWHEDVPACVVCAELEDTDFCPAREQCPQ